MIAPSNRGYFNPLYIMRYNSNVPTLGSIMWGYDFYSSTIHFGKVIECDKSEETILYVYETGTPYYVSVQTVNYTLEGLEQGVLSKITKTFNQRKEHESIWS